MSRRSQASTGSGGAIEAATERLRAGDVPAAIALLEGLLRRQPDDAPALHLAALCHHQLGRFEVAAALLGKALTRNPHDPRLHYALGRTYKDQGSLHKALECYRRALDIAPEALDVLVSFGVALRQSGDLENALAVFERAAGMAPDSAEVAANLGAVLLLWGRLDEAAATLRRAVALRPDLAEAHNNLGLALMDLQHDEEAIDAFQRAIDARPGFVDALKNAGTLLRRRGALKTAAECFAAAAESDYIALFYLGQVRFDLGDYQGALKCFDKIAEMAPEQSQAHLWRGIVLRDQGLAREAIQAWERAADCDVTSAESLAHCADLHLQAGDYPAALAAAQRACERAPGYPPLLNVQGNIAVAGGQVEEALDCYRRSMAGDAHFEAPAGNLMFSSCYSDRLDAAALFDVHRRLGCRPQCVPQASGPVRAARVAGGPVRVGFVSADLNHHSVAFFLEPILRGLHATRFEVFCYYNNRRVDEVTKRFAALVKGWRLAAGLTDQALAQWIIRDEIDILVDLAGHTAGNRMGVFRLKPAPVQATYLGYPTSTGVPEIGYRISDWTVDPEGYERFNSERVVRLPGSYFCYRPPHSAPEIVDPPALRSGRVTFGSFNNLAKISPATVAMWAKAMQAVPGSVLLLKNKALSETAVGERVARLFAANGIDATRLHFAAWQRDPRMHLSTYEQLDIALDPYPYNGATTTCEALWMGVPVVTRKGELHASRMGSSILLAADREDLVTGSEEQFAARCAVLAADLPGLAAHRLDARRRLREARLLDEALFVDGFTGALGGMLQEA